MINNKYLYFRNDEAQNDYSDSVCIPVKNIKGITTNSSVGIRIYYKSAYNVSSDTASEDVISDYASFSFTAGKSLEVLKEIVSAINGNKLSQDGRILIADDFDSVYLHPNITGVTDSHLVTATAFETLS
tara:strand:- start:52 stop:438 length:387 start_codon:yes stop_codon:yes gene_type:complete